MEIDLDRLHRGRFRLGKAEGLGTLRFALSPDSFFTVLVTNNVLRGPLPGSMGLIPQNAANLPALLSASLHQLVLEKRQPGEAYDLVVRDSKSGFVFFNIEGHHYDYDAGTRSFSINDGQLLISDEFARQLGRPWEALAVAGKISVTASMYPIEIQTVVNGEVQAAVLPPVRSRADAGAPNQPDAFVRGLMSSWEICPPWSNQVVVLELMEALSAWGWERLLVITETRNSIGSRMPDNDHPVIPQNLYRMSGGTSNNDRFEQIGQSWLKHAFAALQGNACGFGCVPHPSPTPAGDGPHLGVGCSDPYSASLNYSQGFGLSMTGLGSRAWVNPFTGFYPRGDSATPPNNHTGHTHTGTSHRVTVAMSDLNTTLNPGATYFAEGQYVTPHEYAWCQAHAGQCNMYNNVSYRRFSVASSNQTNFSFSSSPFVPTVRMQPAIQAWTGATINQFEPDPGVDGIAFIGCKVTNPSAGVWHYEYAVYNENLDRAIQSFSVPLGPGMTVSNIGFHAPPQEPGFLADGTVGDAGYSSAAWTPAQTFSSLTWSSETFAQNQNANAIRWGTLYNFRFDCDSPPQTTNATIGFFKTGAPMTVGIQGPAAVATPTPTPTATAYPSRHLTNTDTDANTYPYAHSSADTDVRRRRQLRQRQRHRAAKITASPIRAAASFRARPTSATTRMTATRSSPCPSRSRSTATPTPRPTPAPTAT